jgi:hypothetical protein
VLSRQSPCSEAANRVRTWLCLAAVFLSPWPPAPGTSLQLEVLRWIRSQIARAQYGIDRERGRYHSHQLTKNGTDEHPPTTHGNSR